MLLKDISDTSYELIINVHAFETPNAPMTCDTINTYGCENYIFIYN